MSFCLHLLLKAFEGVEKGVFFNAAFSILILFVKKNRVKVNTVSFEFFCDYTELPFVGQKNCQDSFLKTFKTENRYLEVDFT